MLLFPFVSIFARQNRHIYISIRIIPVYEQRRRKMEKQKKEKNREEKARDIEFSAWHFYHGRSVCRL